MKLREMDEHLRGRGRLKGLSLRSILCITKSREV